MTETSSPVSVHEHDHAHHVTEQQRRQGLARTLPTWFIALAAVSAALLIYTQVVPTNWVGSVSNPFIKLPSDVEAWAAITIAVIIQAFPFLVLGVVVSAAISTFASGAFLQRIMPRDSFLAVPTASVSAVALPGCECASVPVSRSLMRSGLSPAASLAFLLAAPSLNPVVIVSTAVAFNAMIEMAWARFFASLLAVILAGWAWIILGDNRLMKDRLGEQTQEDIDHHRAEMQGRTAAQKWATFQAAALHDLTQAGSFLVLGAMVAGLVKVVIPAQWFLTLARQPALVILVMALFAILLSLCSEADAFVAASFTAVSPTAQLVFLVVGPVVDIKLIAMQGGSFGWAFTRRFVPIVLVCAILSASLVGMIIFGRF
ncbi:permease [Corynebacterium uterequi]|uniref:Putative permease n=1 Tax=Corynebacterium uterequi TaxID=1072256 RepID=A0A0G3HFN6_9CORY|nr:permease [Corynebacterium uterequi]AKK12121.1 putative permease [Corynebacterium uterequi]